MTIQESMNRISAELGLPHFDEMRSGTVPVPFMRSVLLALGLEPAEFTNNYQRIEAALDAVGKDYDPSRDSSEAADKGGNNITGDGLERLLDGIQSQAALAEPVTPFSAQTPVLGSLAHQPAPGSPNSLPVDAPPENDDVPGTPFDASAAEQTKIRRDLDRATELRAVALVNDYLEADDWVLTDRQRDGCGYDVLAQRAGEELHVEIKGIRSKDLVFNLTELEWRRAMFDPEFRVIAVTRVLTATPQLQILGQAALFAAERRVTQYRLKCY